MSFRLVPKSVTMNDLTRRNNSKVAGVYPFGLSCVLSSLWWLLSSQCATCPGCMKNISVILWAQKTCLVQLSTLCLKNSTFFWHVS